MHQREPSFEFASTWLIPIAPPAAFLLAIAITISFSAPEHDDYCFAFLNSTEGFVRTIHEFYTQLTGRLVPLFAIQLPAALASATGASLLTWYAISLTLGFLFMLGGCALAFARMWPRLSLIHLSLLTAAFASTIIARAPSPRELLFWLPSFWCYVPPAIVSIWVLAELVRAIDQQEKLSVTIVVSLAVAALLASLCNEFTGVWLLMMAIWSCTVRYCVGLDPQPAGHAVLAAAGALGIAIIVAAPGNSERMSVMPRTGQIGLALHHSLNYAIDRFASFLLSPATIVCIATITTMAIISANKVTHPERDRTLAGAVGLLVMACFCFAYFTHEYATGLRLIERAQNQALVILLFGLSIVSVFVARSFIPQLRRSLSAAGLDLSTWKTPVALSIASVVAIFISPTGKLLRQQYAAFPSFRSESIERENLLRSASGPVVTVPLHKSRPSLLLGADINYNTQCTASYYAKEKIIVADP